MVSNISQIGEVLSNINTTYEVINTTNILPNAIQSTNDSTGGWLGIMIFIMMCFAIVLHMQKRRNAFGLFTNFNLSLFSLSIILDIGVYLLIWGILESYQIFFFIYTLFFVLCYYSLINKDMLGVES